MPLKSYLIRSRLLSSFGVRYSANKNFYTDNETIDYDICQPIILNGIHDVIKNEDMLSRSIILIFEKSASGESVVDEKVSLMEKFKKNPDLVEAIVFFLEYNDYEWKSTMKGFSMKLNEFITLSDADVKIPSTPNRLLREINNLHKERLKYAIL